MADVYLSVLDAGAGPWDLYRVCFCTTQDVIGIVQFRGKIVLVVSFRCQFCSLFADGGRFSTGSL